MEGQKKIRDDVLISLVDRALGDEEFRRKSREDVEATLREYGYELTDEELAAVKEFQAEVAGLSDGELQTRIADARSFGG